MTWVGNGTFSQDETDFQNVMAAVVGQHWMYVTSGPEFYVDASKGQKTRIVLLVADRLSFLSVTNIYVLSICDFQTHLTV